MPKVAKGELSLGEIRNLVRQHNKLSVIKGVDSKSRSALLKEVADMGYRIDHAGKRIVRGKMEITTGKGGEQKPQKRTLRKALVKGGDAPVMSGKKKPPPIPPNVKGRKIKPDRSKLIKTGSAPPMASKAKRGRGRPKGSKNKPKGIAVVGKPEAVRGLYK